LFDTTIRANLRLARPDATDDELTVAVARAFLADPPLLILDEPTTRLDPPTRRPLTADLLHATEGWTVLLITHEQTGSTRSTRSWSSTAAGSPSKAATSNSAVRVAAISGYWKVTTNPSPVCRAARWRRP
jgi:ABC-type transport system involved in cytochrome bd biosynthesis fused ATPase/permease subunit